MPDEIDTFNRFMVGMCAGNIVLLNPPPRGGMTPGDALLLAAYLVSMADPTGDKFAPVLAAVQGT